MENPLLDRIINGPPRVAGHAIRVNKNPVILFAVGLLICLTSFGTVYLHYYRVSRSFPPPNFFEIGGGLVLNGLMPQYFPPVSPRLTAAMTPDQIHLFRNCFKGMAIGSFLIFVAPIWVYCRLFNAAKKKANAEKWRPRDGNW
jgi:hypothetical protein